MPYVNWTVVLTSHARATPFPRDVVIMEAVSLALDSCPAGVSGLEEDNAMVEAALHKMESRQASVTSRCSGMLTAVE